MKYREVKFHCKLPIKLAEALDEANTQGIDKTTILIAAVIEYLRKNKLTLDKPTIGV
jgi:hypothetical protein